MRFTGTSGDDDFSGTAGRDKFDMSQGGNDTVFGQGGKDLIYFGAAFTAGDQIDGGLLTVHHKTKMLATVELQGDYSAGVVFGETTMTNVAHLVLDAGFSYDFTLNDTTIVAGRKMAIDGRALGAGDSLVIDNSAGTDGTLSITTGAGHVELTGGAGDENFLLGGTLDQGDRIDGGAGFNTVYLKGDYTGTLILDPSWISNVGQFQLGTGHYTFIATDAFNASDSSHVNIDGGTNAFVDFDASAETQSGYSFRDLIGTLKGGAGLDSFSNITGTAVGNAGSDTFFGVNGTVDGGDGDDSIRSCQGTIQGGAGNDGYSISTGTFYAGTGDDTFTDCFGTFHLEQSGAVRFAVSFSSPSVNDKYFFGASYTSRDIVEFSNGNDTAFFDGDYSALTVLGSNINVEKLVLAGGHDYNLAVVDMFGKGGGRLEVDASGLGAGDTLTFDARQAGTGRFAVTGGAGDDTIMGFGRDDVLNGGAGDDVLTSYSGTNRLTGGSGADHIVLTVDRSALDTVIYGPAQDSTSTHYDTVSGFDIVYDTFQLGISIAGVDHPLSGGTLDSTDFDTDLAAALNGHLLQRHAILFTADHGDLAGDVFLVVDQNGVAGYQAGADLVIRMDGGNDVQDLNLGNFH